MDGQRGGDGDKGHKGTRHKKPLCVCVCVPVLSAAFSLPVAAGPGSVPCPARPARSPGVTTAGFCVPHPPGNGIPELRTHLRPPPKTGCSQPRRTPNSRRDRKHHGRIPIWDHPNPDNNRHPPPLGDPPSPGSIPAAPGPICALHCVGRRLAGLFLS